MYFVDRKEIEKINAYLNDMTEYFESRDWSVDKLTDQLALERLVHVFAEGFLDIGNQMIDGFIMRDPGSYDDIVDILIDEKVLPEEEEAVYKELVRYRKHLVHNYTEAAQEELFDWMQRRLHTLKQLSVHIDQYLDEELGPVSAFREGKGEED